jgi:hypothetical protein
MSREVDAVAISHCILDRRLAGLTGGLEEVEESNSDLSAYGYAINSSISGLNTILESVKL